jgi:endonuclease YncB( thermonuclease family)
MASPLRPLRLALAATALSVAFAAGGASSASAATCSDYSSQADAQRAADTRDGDGDGIYCEALPCPCLKPGGGGGESAPTPTNPKPKKRAQRIEGRITRVVDGDTIKVRAFDAKRDSYTVRLIGIDTPETKRPGVGIECGGPQASSFMNELAYTDPFIDPATQTGPEVLYYDPGTGERNKSGRRVTLTTDPGQDTFDRYGRLLAYVATKAGKSLQLEMLRAGWATVYVYGGTPFRRVTSYRDAQRRAKNNAVGVWSTCEGDFHTPA